MFGVLAQFFYVGAQVCISSFFIRFCRTGSQVWKKNLPLSFYLSRFSDL